MTSEDPPFVAVHVLVSTLNVPTLTIKSVCELVNSILLIYDPDWAVNFILALVEKPT